MTTTTYRPNDRVTVSDGPGCTLGRGTVLEFHPARPGHDALVLVSLDDAPADSEYGDVNWLLLGVDRVEAIR